MIKIVFLFTADFCKPCQILKEALRALRSNFVLKIIDWDEDEELFEYFGCSSVPLVYVFEYNNSKNLADYEMLLGHKFCGIKSLSKLIALIGDDSS